MSDVLSKICARTRIHVDQCKTLLSLSELEKKLPEAPASRGFRRHLSAKIAEGKFGLIAEIKKASPSKGLIRADFDPAALAQSYEQGGAACLSVLTDRPFFQGDLSYLEQARAACTLPVLRKDFILDPYQIIEAKVAGADCILLIVAALSDEELQELFQLARALDLDVLIETHNEEEIERIKHYQDCLIGINNRNLKTLEVSLEVTKRLAPLLQTDEIVCESGLFTHKDLEEMSAYRAQRFLVGESLMRQQDVCQATKQLLSTEIS